MSTLKVTNLQHPSASNPGLQLDVSGVCHQLGMRNVLINGNPLINQRGYVSGTATSGANEYTLDRWRVVTSGESITFSDSNNIRTVTAPAGGVEQVVEGENLLSGTYTLSWTGSATATVDGNPVTNGGQVTLTGGTNATVRFINGTFSLAQLERGSVATPFELRPVGAEVALCKRYYNVVSCVLKQSGQSTSQAVNFVDFPVQMASAPTPVTTHPDYGEYVYTVASDRTAVASANLSVAYSTSVATVGGSSVSIDGTSQLVVVMSFTGGSTIYGACVANLILDAEL